MNIIQKALSLVCPVTNDRYAREWTGKERIIKKDWKMIDGFHMSKVIQRKESEKK